MTELARAPFGAATKPAVRVGPGASDLRIVTASGIAAYRDAVRTRPLPDAGGRSVVASPLYPFVLATGAFDQVVEQLCAGAGSVVHLSQEVRSGRPVLPGERVAIELHVLAVRRESKGARLALSCLVVGEDGVTASTLLTSVLLVGVVAPEPCGELPAPLPPAPRGEVDATAELVISSATVRRYAEVSGDHNPIHLDPAAGRAAGFPGAIVHGMCVMSTVCEEVVDRYAGGDAAAVTSVAGRFGTPVLPDEPLVATFAPSPDGRTIGFTIATPRGPAIKGGHVRLTRPARRAAGGGRS